MCQEADTPDARRKYCFATLALLATLALAPVSARAQMGGMEIDPSDPGTGGRNAIQGNIFYPSGRRLDKRVRITLASVSRSDMSTMSDDNGSFAFRRLAGGTYTVTVDAGKEFEPMIERVDLIQPQSRRGSGLGQTVTVHIQLRYRSPARTKPEVVDATLAGVAKQAIELYEKAEEATRTGDSKKAIEELRAAIAVFPGFALAFDKLGVQYMLLGQLNDAGQAFRSALKLTPDAFDARLNYGILLVLVKQFSEAEKELRRASDENDSSATAHAYLGRTLAILRKLDEGEKELQRALTLAGDSIGWVYRYLGGIYIERHDNGRAIAAMEKYLQLVPDANDREQIREWLKRLKTDAKASHP